MFPLYKKTNVLKIAFLTFKMMHYFKTKFLCFKDYVINLKQCKNQLVKIIYILDNL